MSVEHDLMILGAGEIDVSEEGLARVAASTATLTGSVASGFVALATVVVATIGGRSAAQRHPSHVDLSRIVVAVARIDLVEHGVTSSPVTVLRIVYGRS